MDYLQNISDRLRAKMEEQGLNNEQLAQALGVHVTTVRSWLRKATYIRLADLVKAANYFGTTLDYLVGRSYKPLDFEPQELPPFVDRIHSILDSRHVSTYLLGKRTKIDYSYLSKWKSGTQKPHLRSLLRLAVILDMTLDDLIGRR